MAREVTSPGAAAPFAGVRVLVFGRDLAAGYAAKLLGDLGADVVVAPLPPEMEAPHHAGLDPWFERMVDPSIRRVALGSDPLQSAASLVPLADVVIESVATEVAPTWMAALRKDASDNAIVCSVSGLGRSGPHAHLDACELLVQARSSYMNLSGFPGRPPTMAGTALASYYTATLTAASIGAALLRRRRTGIGARIDMSRLDCMVSALEGTVEHFFESGRVPRRSGNVHMNIPSGYGIYQAEDGYLAIGVVGDPIWRRFCDALAAPEMLANPLLATQQQRRQYPELIDEVLLPWLASHPRDEAVDILTAAAVPCAPVCSPREALASRARFAAVCGDGTATGLPIHCSRSVTGAPARSEAEVSVESLIAEWSIGPSREAPPRAAGAWSRPLEGITVLDMGTIVAGPYCGMVLADLGASVVKVEAPSRLDNRTNLSGTRKIRGQHELVLVGSYRDREKRSVAIDLKTPGGIAAFKSLCGSADLLIENFAPGAMEELGVGFDALTRENPVLGCVGIKLYPKTAAGGEEVGFDLIAQARCGFAALTGFPEDPPTKSGQSASDYLAGALAALASVAILYERERSGRGQHAEVSLFESLLYALDGELECVAAGGEPRPRLGLANRTHGDRCRIWQCADGFLAVDVTRDSDLGRIRTLLHLDAELDWVEPVAGWMARRSRQDAVTAFCEEGIPAAPVNTIVETCGDSQLWWRGMFAPITDSKFGGLVITGSPVRIDDERVPITRVAPEPGESNSRLLKETP